MKVSVYHVGMRVYMADTVVDCCLTLVSEDDQADQAPGVNGSTCQKKIK